MAFSIASNTLLSFFLAEEGKANKHQINWYPDFRFPFCETYQQTIPEMFCYLSFLFLSSFYPQPLITGRISNDGFGFLSLYGS